jgi:hypothetical protein
MTSANTLPYRVFQRDELIGAFLQHDEAVAWAKDVCERTITTFPNYEPVSKPCVYTVKRYDRIVFTCEA